MIAQHKEDGERLLANAARWGCIGEDGKIDMVRYSAEYCVVDTQVLDAGMHTFRQQVLQALDIDINHLMTISSVADRYNFDRGAFQGVEEVSGIVREFIQRCTVGRRVMMLGNKKRWVNKPGGKRVRKVEDFDGVSLYASAQKRLGTELGGYLMGAPKVWTPEVDVAKVNGYFLKIRVTRVERRSSLPTTRLLKDGRANWTNRLEGETQYVELGPRWRTCAAATTSSTTSFRATTMTRGGTIG
jgi:hypothetical protein